MELTRKVDEEYVVAVDLGYYTDLIETSYKYHLLKDTLIKSLEYSKWAQNKVSIDADKVIPILNALETVAYTSVVRQLVEQNETTENQEKEQVTEEQ